MASIRKRGNTFTITAYLGYDQEGRQIKKTTTFRPPEGVTEGKAEKLAKAYATKWEDDIRGYVALDENKTVSQLAQWYYDNVAPSVLRPNILKAYRDQIYKHIIPRIGHLKLKDITPPLLDSMFTKLRTEGNSIESFIMKDRSMLDGINREVFARDNDIGRSTLFHALKQPISKSNAEKIAKGLGKPFHEVFEDACKSHGLSGSSVNKLKLNLSAIFTAAVKKEIMRRNPCKLVTPQKNDTAPAAFLTEEQCQRLLKAAHEQPDFQLEVIINFFLATGIRSGELCALHWDDIDLETGLLQIRHTLVRMNGEFIRQEPKTETSNRRIVLPPYIISLLKKHRATQTIRGLREGGIVFTNRSGNYLLGANLNKKLDRICTSAGIPGIHLHSLRHTYASLLINSGITAKVIANQLGHSTTKTTLDTYSHVYAESEAKAMKAVEMALFTAQETSII